VLDPAAFARVSPLDQQTWMLSVSRERVVWQRTAVTREQAFLFDAATWRAPVASPRKRP